MRPAAARLADVAKGSTFGYMYRVNRVPYYQRLFQKHDGLRQWDKTPKSAIIMPTFRVMMWTGFAGTMYMMFRMVLGHKTWY